MFTPLRFIGFKLLVGTPGTGTCFGLAKQEALTRGTLTTQPQVSLWEQAAAAQCVDIAERAVRVYCAMQLERLVQAVAGDPSFTQCATFAPPKPKTGSGCWLAA